MNNFDLCESVQFNFTSPQNFTGHHQNSPLIGSNWSSPCSFLLDLFRRRSTGGGDDDGNRARYSRDLITYYVAGIAGLTVSCLGIVGNAVSVAVLTRRTMQSSTYTYLTALAVCDSAFLVCVILLTTKDLRRIPRMGDDGDGGIGGSEEEEELWELFGGGGGGEFYPYLFQYVHPVASMLQVTSIWLTLAFTVDRYIVICHPFHSERLCTIGRARKVVFGLALASVAYNIPKFFEYRTVRFVHPLLPLGGGGGSTGVRCDLTPFGKTRLFRQLYHSWLYVAFVCGVPFAALAVLNAFLVRAVRASSRRLSREIGGGGGGGGGVVVVVLRQRNDTTVMLIGVVAVFFVCQTPALVSRVAWAFAEDAARKFSQVGFHALNEVGNLFVTVNSSVNFVPYYLFGRRFRRQLKRLVERYCCGFGRGGGGGGGAGRGGDHSPSQQPVYSFSLTVATGCVGGGNRRRQTLGAIEYRKGSSGCDHKDSLI